MATAIALVTQLPHLIPFTLQFITYCILVSAFLCFFLWFTYPITCFCYSCDPLAWPFNPQLFRLHPSLCCSAAVPSAALYLSFSFQHVKTSNCFMHVLIRFLHLHLLNVHFSYQHVAQLLWMFSLPSFGGFVHP